MVGSRNTGLTVFTCVSFPVFLEFKYILLRVGKFNLSIGLKTVKFFKGELYLLFCFSIRYTFDSSKVGFGSSASSNFQVLLTFQNPVLFESHGCCYSVSHIITPPYFFLEIRIIIIISSHPWYHIKSEQFE